MSDTVEKPPAGTGAAGRRLWRSVLDRFELDEHELVILREAVRTVDVLAALHKAVRRDGPLIDSPQGMKAHPAVVEARQQRLVAARLLAALRLPDEDDTSTTRPQRRTGMRGTYGLRGLPGTAS